MMPAMHGHAETFACVDREQRTRQELPEHGVDCVRQVRRDRRLLVEAQAVAYADDHDNEREQLVEERNRVHLERAEALL